MLSRWLVVLALFLATSSSALHIEQELPKTRKTLGFGFDKPHARFVTVPHRVLTSNVLLATSKPDPLDIAHTFLKSLLPASEEYSYRIRKDSYTDETTGVTHVYAKQLFQGLEVADSAVNLNIKDGVILSYGNEFFQPDHVVQRDQTPLIVPEPFENDQPQSQDAILEPTDPRLAALSFISLATPSSRLSSDIKADLESYLNNIEIHSQDWLVSEDDISQADIMLKGVPDTAGDVRARLVWAQTPGGLELSWKLEVPMEDNWYETTISAYDDSRIFSVVDWVSDSPLSLYVPSTDIPSKAAFPLSAIKEKPRKPTEPEPVVDPTYLVFSWGINDPEEGNRTIIQYSQDGDQIASPYGWHTIPVANVPKGLDDSFAPIPNKGNKTFFVTVGNNVFAQENFEGQNRYLTNYRPDGGPNMTFVFPYHPKPANDSDGRLREARKHINATITQIFYTTNKYHDLMYRYGFNEPSGNFQQYNFGKGGAEDDAVIANAQDGSGFNNANFMTPPDGSAGRMRMYIWNTATPYRDGDFEAGIVIHELSHGLSTRLTGGPADSSCLGWGESGGMGEGWGDFLATTIRSTKNYSDYPMGSWASNTIKGIRNYPYSLDKGVNPETYKSVDKYFGVHPIGEVWAEMLWVVLQRLVVKHGFTESLYPPAPLENGTIPENDFYKAPTTPNGPKIPKHGNSLMVQLVVNGMKLQKCRPGFLDARDAIIQADQILTGGENLCEIWAGFAERGLGVDARVLGRTPWGGGTRTNGFAVPPKCNA